MENGASEQLQIVPKNSSPYGLAMSENCVTCKLRESSWFCSFSSSVLEAFDAASHISLYPSSAVLFVEGQMPRGAFVLCSGKVKLSTTSLEGKVLILRIVEAGEVLGLSAVISGTCYQVTAETVTPSQVNFTERGVLLRLMEKYGDVGLHSAQALSADFQTACRDIYDLVLSPSSTAKLARLLLSRVQIRDKGHSSGDIVMRNRPTHEAMAQMIGTSRETVTRSLSAMKKKKILRVRGTSLLITSLTALEEMAHESPGQIRLA